MKGLLLALAILVSATTAMANTRSERSMYTGLFYVKDQGSEGMTFDRIERIHLDEWSIGFGDMGELVTQRCPDDMLCVGAIESAIGMVVPVECQKLGVGSSWSREDESYSVKSVHEEGPKDRRYLIEGRSSKSPHIVIALYSTLVGLEWLTSSNQANGDQIYLSRTSARGAMPCARAK